MEPIDYYRDHKIAPLVPIRSRINLVHMLLTYLFTVYFNIIILSTPIRSMYSLPFMFSDQDFFYIHRLSMRAICPAHLICHHNNIW
jgi:hypothetical protein